MKRSASICSLLFILFCFNMEAQQALSLSDAIKQGLENSFSVKAQKERVAIAKNNNTWANAGRTPEIAATLDFRNAFTFQENPASIVIEQTNLNNALVPGLALNWTLFDGHRIRFSKQQFEELVNQSDINVNSTIETIVQEVSLAYFNALLRQEELNVFKTVLDLSRDQIKYQEVKKEFGQSVTFDLLQVQDAYLNDSIAYVRQQGLLNTAMQNLNTAMRTEDLSQRYNLTDSLSFEPFAIDKASLKEEMLASNNNLELAKLARELANINTRIQEAAKLPTVSLNAGTTFNASLANGEQVFNFESGTVLQTIDDARANTFNGFVNVSATYNLYNGGQRKRNIENAQKEEIIAQLEVEDLKQTLSNNLENAYTNYQSQLEIVNLSRGLLDNARQNLNIAEERFRGGIINSFDYRAIQVRFVNANLALVNAIYNMKITEVDLLRLSGQLVNAGNE